MKKSIPYYKKKTGNVQFVKFLLQGHVLECLAYQEKKLNVLFDDNNVQVACICEMQRMENLPLALKMLLLTLPMHTERTKGAVEQQ